MMGCTEQIMFTTAHVVLAQENVCFILILGARDSKTEDLVKSFPQSFDENYLYICFFFSSLRFQKTIQGIFAKHHCHWTKPMVTNFRNFTSKWPTD